MSKCSPQKDIAHHIIDRIFKKCLPIFATPVRHSTFKSDKTPKIWV